MDILSPNGPERKICTKCSKPKLLDDFPTCITLFGTETRQEVCKSCVSKHNRQLQKEEVKILQKVRKKPLEKTFTRRRSKLKRKYGLKLEEYDAMLEAQNGLCALCGEPETSKDHRTGEVRRLAIDHDHETKKVRALLCYRCNTNLGRFEQFIERNRHFQNYLDRHK